MNKMAHPPVLLISDTHYHNFGQYAQVLPSGVNSRLQDILRATLEAAKALREAGGDTIIHAGDVFHVRGKLAPSVLNPVLDLYKALIQKGFKVYMLSGNHDLETKDAKRLSSGVTALENVGVMVITEPVIKTMPDGQIWHLVPWIENLDDLRREIGSVTADNTVIHAPMNNVIRGIPNHGLGPKDFEKAGCKRVFCGHYHNHRSFHFGSTGIAYSIGALTHQNWGDVDSACGYMLVWPDRAEQRDTSAPKFRVIKPTTAITDAYVTDNYIKVVDGDFDDPREVQDMKDRLILAGAKAVVVEGLVRKPSATRGGAKTTGAPTLATILSDYIDRTYPGEDEVKAKALKILGEVT